MQSLQVILVGQLEIFFLCGQRGSRGETLSLLDMFLSPNLLAFRQLHQISGAPLYGKQDG